MARSLDFLSDLGVIAFAAWTLIAYVGMATEAKATLLVAVWLAAAGGLAVLLAVLDRRAAPARASDPAPGAAAADDRRPSQRVVIVAVCAGLVSALLAATVATEVWPLVWIGAAAAVGAAALRGRWRSVSSEQRVPLSTWPGHLVAVFAGLAFAVLSLIVNRPNGDDTFYVNRAVGTAELNRIPVRDIIFTHERIDPIASAGNPVETFAALAGASARFLGLHGASMAYYVVPPLMTFMATWALWRLIRAWAPRALVLCFMLGCVYLTFSAQDALTPGSYFLNRMWQGKVIFVAWLVPTAYVLLTRWLSRRDFRTGLLLLAFGVASIGMTTSATFVAPLLVGTALLAVLVRRDWRALPVLVATAAIPFGIGVVATRMYPVELIGGHPLGNAYFFHEVFGIGALGAVSLVGLWAAPWLARRGTAALLTSTIAVVALVLLTPELLPTLNDLTQLMSILRRTLWIIPYPALVGLLAAVPVVALVRRVAGASPPRRALAAAAPAAVAAALLVGLGHPVWTSWRNDNPLWDWPPSWKIHPGPHKDAAAILSHYDGPGAVLAREPVMHAIGLVTIDPKPVNPRGFYSLLAPEPGRLHNGRIRLTRFVDGEEPQPTREQVARALSDLDVGLICVRHTKPTIISDVESLGYAESFKARGLVCLERSPPA